MVIYVGYNLVDINIQAPGAFTLADINFKSISWVVLATGVIIVLIAAFGFFGSCCESSAMLNLVNNSNWLISIDIFSFFLSLLPFSMDFY